jgi:hypothetical protein
MKHFSSLVAVVTALVVFSGSSIAQSANNNDLFSLKVAKSGCCKARQSTKNPWVKVNKSFEDCQNASGDGGDQIYNGSGLYWWDRSC